jgi:hypothetical protein
VTSDPKVVKDEFFPKGKKVLAPFSSLPFPFPFSFFSLMITLERALSFLGVRFGLLTACSAQ